MSFRLAALLAFSLFFGPAEPALADEKAQTLAVLKFPSAEIAAEQYEMAVDVAIYFLRDDAEVSLAVIDFWIHLDEFVEQGRVPAATALSLEKFILSRWDDLELPPTMKHYLGQTVQSRGPLLEYLAVRQFGREVADVPVTVLPIDRVPQAIAAIYSALKEEPQARQEPSHGLATRTLSLLEIELLLKDRVRFRREKPEQWGWDEKEKAALRSIVEDPEFPLPEPVRPELVNDIRKEVRKVVFECLVEPFLADLQKVDPELLRMPGLLSFFGSHTKATLAADHIVRLLQAAEPQWTDENYGQWLAAASPHASRALYSGISDRIRSLLTPQEGIHLETHRIPLLFYTELSRRVIERLHQTDNYSRYMPLNQSELITEIHRSGHPLLMPQIRELKAGLPLIDRVKLECQLLLTRPRGMATETTHVH